MRATIERMFPALDHLNDEQRRAATFDGDQLRILAGAGTGKTTALTARIAWLAQSGIPAERIMALTFTRRAAREMVHRTETLLSRSAGASGSRRRSRVLGGTFHSIAHQTLRRHAPALGLPEGFSMLDSGDAADVIAEREGLHQISDTGALEKIVDEVIAANPKQVEQYRGGKTTVINFLVGQAMKATRGQANVAAVTELLKQKLE